MITKIKALIMRSFKGVSEKEIAFDCKDTTISGANATGKTTIADAIFWTLTGKDSKLKDNPTIIPMGVTEANPDVTVVLDIDGKEVSIRKVQTYKVKDGKESTSNQYFVNDVPMTERDYKSRIEEYGVDVEMFLPLSHPDYLLADSSKKGRDIVRGLLFKLADDRSDKEIAEKAGLTKLAEMLDTYKVNEVEAKNKATLARIDKEIGKDNKVANARIDELLKHRSGVNADAVKAEIEGLKKEIASCIEEKTKTTDAIKKVKADIMQTSFDINGLGAELNDRYRNELFDIECLEEKNNVLLNASIKAESEYESELRRLGIELERITNDIKDYKEYIRTTEAKQIDTGKATICPTCGQIYPVGMLEGIRYNFDKQKEADIKQARNVIETLEKSLATTKEKADALSKKHKAEVLQREALASESTRIRNLKDKLVKPDVTGSKEYIELTQNKAELTTAEGILEDELRQIEEKLDATTDKKYSLEKELILVEQDKEIDGRIAEIRAEIRQAEINRTEAEKILDDLAKLNKAKNESLEESVNKRFRLVKWKLFRTLKNGSYEDACIPMIDGYELGTSTNKAREILAKLDVVAGLQKAYDKFYPIILDNAEALSKATLDRIEIETQLIKLIVTEDTELKIERT